MSALVFTDAHERLIREEFNRAAHVESVIILSGFVTKTAGFSRFVAREVHLPPGDAYAVRNSVAAELSSAYLGPLIRRLRGRDSFVAFIHNHPGDPTPSFSRADDEGERHLAPFLERQFESSAHLSAIAGASKWTCRTIGIGEQIRVCSVGRYFAERTTTQNFEDDSSFHDRQVTVFGAEGQRAIQSTHFAIVGAGGTGSIVAQSMAYLGARQITLVDFDVVDETNLNRLVGATARTVGRLKVDVVADHIRNINPACNVTALAGDVSDTSIAAQLLEADAIFSCTDSHGSRAVMNQLAYQYYIPVFDIGVGIHANAGKIERIGARVQMLSPGLGCLTCGNLLDPNEVRRDLMTPAQRRADPYFMGARVAQPAVISLNQTAASLAVTLSLGALAGFPIDARMQVYDAILGTVRSVEIAPTPNCIVCSTRGALGRGSSWDLPSRN